MNYTPMDQGPGMPGGPRDPNQLAMLALMKYMREQQNGGGTDPTAGPDYWTMLAQGTGALGNMVGTGVSSLASGVANWAGGMGSSMAGLFDGI